MGAVGYRALLIGNGNFEADPQNLKSLAGPRNDVRLLKDALTHPEMGLHASGDVDTLIDADNGEILRAIESFFDGATKDQQLLLYYSGHGRLDIKNRLYLCARNTQTNLIKSTAVQADDVRKSLDDCAATAVIVMLDCCYSGAFKGGDAAIAGFGGKGRFVLTSSRHDELSADAEIGGYSAFTRFVGEALLSGEVDGNADGRVSVNEIYDYVLPRLRQATGQIPHRHLDKSYGDPYLGRALRREAATTRAPARAGRPKLAVSEKEIKLRSVKFDETLRDEVIDVFNEGDGELDWTAECADDWIELVVARGHFVIKLRPRPGHNRAAVRVRDRNGGGSETVRLEVEMEAAPQKPRLEVYPESLDFGTLTPGGASSGGRKSIELHNVGGGDLAARVRTTEPWLQARLKGEAILVSLSDVPVGRQRAAVEITSAGGDASIPVTVEIELGPTLVVSPAAIDFGEVTEGVVASKRVEVRNSGSGSLEWSHRDAPDFVDVTRSGSGLNVKLASKTGTHVGSIRITGNGGEQTIQLRATVLPAAAKPSPALGKAPAPAPATPTAAPNATWREIRDIVGLARANHIDIAGMWQGAGGGMFRFLGTGPEYRMLDLNAMGVQVGQGTARVEGNQVHIEAVNMFTGAWSVDLQVNGALMSGSAFFNGQFVTLLLQRAS